MKISLDTKEIEDAISLWLERKLMGGATYDVTVKRAASTPGKEGKPTAFFIEAEASPTETPDAISLTSALDKDEN